MKSKIFWFIWLFISAFGSFFLLLTPIKIDLHTQLVISLILAGFYSKNETDRTELENKIFELKKLLENKKDEL